MRQMKHSASIKLLSQIEVPMLLSWGSSALWVPVTGAGSERSEADAGAGGEHPPPAPSASAEGPHLYAKCFDQQKEEKLCLNKVVIKSQRDVSAWTRSPFGADANADIRDNT